MRSSYNKGEVTLLLKDVTGMLKPLDTAEREKKIQSGTHYSEMLPLEYKPTPAYYSLYRDALAQHSGITAAAVRNVAEKIYAYKKDGIVLVSLARAGTPVGILLKRYLDKTYHLDVPHYTISIIRGRGIDQNAMHHILDRHTPESVQFVDGWIGKGAIIRELQKEVHAFHRVDAELAVLADPAGLTKLYGTTEDFLIPSACLNATVSGLFSRTILNDEIIGQDDFHGAVYFKELEPDDVSNEFLDRVTEKLWDVPVISDDIALLASISDVGNISKHFNVSNINFIKPGIGETTRVLLRRIPWKVLVRDIHDEKYIGHIKRLCEEKGIEIEEYPLQSYRSCGIIKNLNADI